MVFIWGDKGYPQRLDWNQTSSRILYEIKTRPRVAVTWVSRPRQDLDSRPSPPSTQSLATWLLATPPAVCGFLCWTTSDRSVVVVVVVVVFMHNMAIVVYICHHSVPSLAQYLPGYCIYFIAWGNILLLRFTSLHTGLFIIYTAV